jgi:hypothetical protein
MSDDQPPMPAPEQPSGPPSPAPPVLTETPPANPVGYLAQMFFGFASFLFLSVGTTGLVLTVSLMRQTPSQRALPMAISLLLVGLGVSVWVFRYKRGRGLVAGFLVGLGLSALGAGLCFTILK